VFTNLFPLFISLATSAAFLRTSSLLILASSLLPQATTKNTANTVKIVNKIFLKG